MRVSGETGHAEMARRMTKEGIPSRAYIAFKHEAQVATFSRAYDGHVFRDKAGASVVPHPAPLWPGLTAWKGTSHRPWWSLRRFRGCPRRRKRSMRARIRSIKVRGHASTRGASRSSRTDDDYLSFLETLKQAGKTESLSLEALS